MHLFKDSFLGYDFIPIRMNISLLFNRITKERRNPTSKRDPAPTPDVPDQILQK